MKRLIMLLALAMFVLSGCSDNAESTPEEKKQVDLKVASLIPPMTDILEIAKPLMKEEGINLEIVVLGDNIQPNNALANKEVDANFFQHKPFMEQYNESNGTELVRVEPIYHAIFGAYSKKYKTMDELPEGATIAIPNDQINLARSLVMFADQGIIKLKDGVGLKATQADIVENVKNYKFKEVDLLMLARMMDDADLVTLYPSYAEPLGLKPSKDAVITENVNSTFAISLVARKDNAKSEAIQLLAEKMTGPEVKKFLEENFADTSLPAFD
ncbi:MetQ/NlpA family ABC transporter substrate-binding protein [Peribacillus huizhouensis]|uniref:Lipoprotein n=1 Tax=Peribacillus huizhouensis TaxID=1501239 RepID=A0ABR6CSK7_9BACI|nr:MetQ/NlpA family ABC transporter substrate-binding protein [Peribacillus huizhouensis]MBA9027342.1 D-methionine transport system substrate-binding protein [Peribacillus huizhouensis]